VTSDGRLRQLLVVGCIFGGVGQLWMVIRLQVITFKFKSGSDIENLGLAKVQLCHQEEQVFHRV
jgi:hypothetical protein